MMFRMVILVTIIILAQRAVMMIITMDLLIAITESIMEKREAMIKMMTEIISSAINLS